MLKKSKKFIKKIFFKDVIVAQQNTNDKMFPVDLIPITDTRDEDVFVVGFPKSGNTLMQHIITHLVYGINKEGSRSMVNFIVPDIYTNTHYFRFNDVCFFKSHNLPEKRYKKVIYIMRDGREALLSYYHMMKNMGKEVSLEDLYMGKVDIFGGTWQKHILSWEKNPFNADILWIKFEDLKNNKLKELKRICNFLNITRTDIELNEVVKLTSIGHMKELEKREDWTSMKKGKFLDGMNFIRKGNLDTFKKEVPDDLINIFEISNSISLKKYYK
ncbi:sulfotransferase domain-containing protein [uncultured Lutibacter sp.]|uniref:sulfotransferase domain-containing protein n=1 Tax=uncultured Lutibacter sp. TaxID=437739 RepID=UPI0026224DCA|nr:sulfotransferase domain-containing protein [uncultured Lutibacter sp.]